MMAGTPALDLLQGREPACVISPPANGRRLAADASMAATRRALARAGYDLAEDERR
jgi:hypothetical protein